MEAGDVGIVIVVAGVLMLLAEVFIPGFFIAVPGTAAIIFGILIVAFPGVLSTWWGPWILAALTIPITAAAIMIYRRLSPPSRPVTKSYEGLVGEVGVVVEEVRPGEMGGLVRVAGDVWSAVARTVEPIPPGRRVRVVAVEGVHLIVEPAEDSR